MLKVGSTEVKKVIANGKNLGIVRVGKFVAFADYAHIAASQLKNGWLYNETIVDNAHWKVARVNGKIEVEIEFQKHLFWKRQYDHSPTAVQGNVGGAVVYVRGAHKKTEGTTEYYAYGELK